jgi:hypothetical protein
MHIVEIRRHGADLGAIMAQMRAWLDHHQAEPSLFELSFLPDREIRFRLQFQNASDALAFVRVFDDEVLGERDTAVAA